MARTSQRTAVFTESLIREMSRVAARHGAINLAQGFPDWDPPPALVHAAKDAMDMHRHQYAVTWGSPELRTALGAKLTRFMGVPVDAERELVVTCGATEAMMVAMMTVCDPGDRVAALSGPNLAPEIAAQNPSSSVIASPVKELRDRLQETLKRLRVKP